MTQAYAYSPAHNGYSGWGSLRRILLNDRPTSLRRSENVVCDEAIIFAALYFVVVQSH